METRREMGQAPSGVLQQRCGPCWVADEAGPLPPEVDAVVHSAPCLGVACRDSTLVVVHMESIPSAADNKLAAAHDSPAVD